jgi:hypothetical protein
MTVLIVLCFFPLFLQAILAQGFAKKSALSSSVADPGMFIPDPNFFQPGSKFFPSQIRIKEFKYFSPKEWFLSSGNMIRVVHPESGSRIRIFYTNMIRVVHPGSGFLPDPGVNIAPDRGSAALLPREETNLMRNFAVLQIMKRLWRGTSAWSYLSWVCRTGSARPARAPLSSGTI